MKTTIDGHGNLTVKAETELESYALNMWWKNYQEES